MQQLINYNEYTELPCRTLIKADRANSVIEIQTPHKGIVFIETKEVDKGIFRQATELDRKTNHVIDEIQKLEDEAKDYLLNKWICNN